MRDAAEQRLGTVVASLELIRLDLLRLRAGATTLESVTQDLTRASEIGEQTGRLVRAAEEVRALLAGKAGPP